MDSSAPEIGAASPEKLGPGAQNAAQASDSQPEKKQQQQQQPEGEEQQQGSPIPIRAPVSEDVEDDGASVESGESFDSALERIAGSSTASFDTAASPRGQVGDEESETARVMPKALVSAEDKQSSGSSSSSSSSESDNDEEEVENGIESTGETGMEEEQGLPVMPFAKVSTEDEVLNAERQIPDVEDESAPVVGDEGSDGEPGENNERLTPEAPVELSAKDEPLVEKPEDEVAEGGGEEEAQENEVPEVGGEEEAQENEAPAQGFQPATPPAETPLPEQPEVKDSAKLLDEETEAEGHTKDEKIEEEEEEAATPDMAELKARNFPEEELLTPKIPEHVEATRIEDHLQEEGDSEIPETESDEEDDENNEDENNDEVQETLKTFRSAAAEKPSTLGSAGPSLPARPAPRPAPPSSTEPSRAVAQGSPQNPNTTGGSQSSPSAAEAEANGEPDENIETREKLHQIRVKFLRLAQRLGQSVQNVVVAQVLYRLGLAEQLRGSRGISNRNAFSFDRASDTAEQQEASGEPELDFTCTIMVLGKTGVGKSATINSLFDAPKTATSAFAYSTKKVQEITGTVHGIKLRVIDTPGLLPAVADQRHNEKVMASVKKFIKKSPPDIVLYFDRLDMQSRDYSDLPLLRTITDTFGAAIWFNAIVVLTHASSAPPDGPNGLPMSYEMFVAQRSHIVQQTIRQAAGDMRLMNPVSLVENHSACRTNRAGERVLPNGQVWKPQLLLLCFASKILAEANTLLKLQENIPGKPFGGRSKVPPLPFLLSSLLQSRQPLKHPDEIPGEEDGTDDDMDEVEESDDDEEYDDLPPFRRLTKEELEQLDKKTRAAYMDELHLREKLFRKKQWKEELRRRKELRRRAASSSPEDYLSQLPDEEDDLANRGSAPVAVPLPDMALPPTFDSDNHTHRYRSLETATQWLARPVLETHGWDHDNGYDGLNLERGFLVKNKIPASISGQVTKDKKEANLTMECAASLKHGEGKVSQASFDVQTVGKDMSYTLRSETRFNNFKKNKTIAGAALTMIGDTFALGLKLEDRLMIGKRLKVVMNGGALSGKGDRAYGGTVEISLRDKDFPIGRTLSSLGFSVMNWHGDVALGGNLQSQFTVGRTSIVARGNLNNRGAGQITIKASSSEQLQMALVGLLPLIRALVGHKLIGGSSQQV